LALIIIIIIISHVFAKFNTQKNAIEKGLGLGQKKKVDNMVMDIAPITT
jgi:hypothetical protein